MGQIVPKPRRLGRKGLSPAKAMSNLLGSNTVGPLPTEPTIFGCSEAMRSVRDTVDKVAATNLPVLITGESGTGKEVIAKLIHCLSPWRNAPFVKVSCAAFLALPFENELFGHEWGAFVAAQGTKPASAQLAQGGTLFLDEIAELAPTLQAELLNLLRDGQFCLAVEGGRRNPDVRIICAGDRKLDKDVGKGSFRQDLYYRLNVVHLELPSLRERRADIPLILDYLLACYSTRYDRPVRPISPSLLEMLQKFDWPGNIRQLENLAQRYVILGSEHALMAELLHTRIRSGGLKVPTGAPISLKNLTKQAIQEFERDIILKELEANQWKRKDVASALNISYRALLYKMRKAGLPGNRAGMGLLKGGSS